jgi:hypothetical protein
LISSAERSHFRPGGFAAGFADIVISLEPRKDLDGTRGTRKLLSQKDRLNDRSAPAAKRPPS